MNPSLCYLCGLPIPPEVVSSLHPLFGTVDHIIARKRRGSDAIYNRAPAHRICNIRKGHVIVHPEEFATELQAIVVPLLERLGHKISSKARKRGIRRVLSGWPEWAPRSKRETHRAALERWEDDGGALRPLTDTTAGDNNEN